MNAPPMPEPVNQPMQRGPGGALSLHLAPPLRRFFVEGLKDFAVEVSEKPESIYLLGTPNGSEIPVPCRVCGSWNAATLSGRHFFFAHEPDAALDLTSVRQAQHYVGRLSFPSGWAASPWLSDPSRRALLRRLHAFTEAFKEQRLMRSPALSRATRRAT